MMGKLDVLLRLQDERFHGVSGEAFIEGHKRSIIDHRIRRQISVAPKIRRCLIDVRIALK